MQQIGIRHVAIAAIQATAEKPIASNAEAEIVATIAIPTCEAAFRNATYSPRTAGDTISVVSACNGACRAAAAMLSAAMPSIKPVPDVDRATRINKRAKTTLAQMITLRLPA